jgi:hypothetical protein
MIIITSIDGLYDEKNTAELHSINNRKAHNFLYREHKWVNASLEWRNQEYDAWHNDRRPRSEQIDNPSAGTMWAFDLFSDRRCIRFCLRCKQIDCPHLFKESQEYERQFTPYSGQQWLVSTCDICKRRILMGSNGYSRPSNAAFKLMDRVARDLGRNPPGINSGYGSGWFIELPACISQVIDAQGEAEAERLVRLAYEKGDSSVVTRPMIGY